MTSAPPEPVLDRIRQTIERQAESLDDRCRRLVAAVARGEDVAAEVVTLLGQTTRWTADDFDAAVRTLARRIDRRVRLDAVPGLEAGRADVERQVAEVDAELDRAMQTHADARRPLDRRLAALKREVTAAQDAARELRQTADPAKVARRDAIDAELSAAAAEVGDIRKMMAECRRVIDYRPPPGLPDYADARGTYRNSAYVAADQARERATRRFTELEALLPPAEAKVADAEARLAAANADLLVP